MRAKLFLAFASILATLRAAAAGSARAELSLDLLRGDLSHESSAKVARLSGLFAEWRAGRYRPEDPGDAGDILSDVERLVLRHASLAVTRPTIVPILIRVLMSIRLLRGAVKPAGRHQVLPRTHLTALENELRMLRTLLRRLVQRLSALHAVRAADLAAEAADEIRREIGGRFGPDTVPVVFSDETLGHSAWVPRAEAERWIDLLRNIIRNAVQATEERYRRDLETKPAEVLIRAVVRPGGTQLLVSDQGVGMAPGMVDRIWQEGAGTHGAGRGRGLTDDKLDFLRARGDVEVRSVEGVGTTVAITIARRPIPLPAPSPLPVRAAGVGLLVLGVAVLVVGFNGRGLPEIAATEVRGQSVLVARDGAGDLLWQTQLEPEILPNRPLGARPGKGDIELDRPRVFWRDHTGRIRGVVTATLPDQGPGSLWLLDAQGRIVWRHKLTMTVPAGHYLGKTASAWQATGSWDSTGSEVLICRVQDHVYHYCEIQFLSWNGELLGAYRHPGHLEFVTCTDVDNDTRDELILAGINNYAGRDPSVVPYDTDHYVYCLVLLELPRVGGQAWPYADWPEIPAAREEGYLLIPALSPHLEPAIGMVDVVPPEEGREARIEVRVLDGRIYRLDTRLHPQACLTGDHTAARALVDQSDRLPLVHFRRGVRSNVDVPMQERFP